MFRFWKCGLCLRLIYEKKRVGGCREPDRKYTISPGLRPGIHFKSDARVSDPEFVLKVTPGSKTRDTPSEVTPGYKISSRTLWIVRLANKVFLAIFLDFVFESRLIDQRKLPQILSTQYTSSYRRSSICY